MPLWPRGVLDHNLHLTSASSCSEDLKVSGLVGNVATGVQARSLADITLRLVHVYLKGALGNVLACEEHGDLVLVTLGIYQTEKVWFLSLLAVTLATSWCPDGSSTYTSTSPWPELLISTVNSDHFFTILSVGSVPDPFT